MNVPGGPLPPEFDELARELQESLQTAYWEEIRSVLGVQVDNYQSMVNEMIGVLLEPPKLTDRVLRTAYLIKGLAALRVHPAMSIIAAATAMEMLAHERQERGDGQPG